MSIIIKGEELNILIYKYLLEAGELFGFKRF